MHSSPSLSLSGLEASLAIEELLLWTERNAVRCFERILPLDMLLITHGMRDPRQCALCIFETWWYMPRSELSESNRGNVVDFGW
jgi:hypothetical protein